MRTERPQNRYGVDNNLSISTGINGQPNHQVSINPSGFTEQGNAAWRNWQNLTGGVGQIGSGVGNAAAGSASATTQQVHNNQLMSRQLNSLLDAGGSYMDRARQSGLNLAHQRGLGNSSIAAGNAMGAAIDRAAPIAGFDASRYGSVADQNMAAHNQASLTNAQLETQASIASANNAAANARFDMGNQNQMAGMMLGHQLGGLDDFRRHLLAMESREDDQAFRAEQADIDRSINQDQFNRSYGLDRDRFGHTVDQDHWSRIFNQSQADRSYGLDRDRFGHTVDQDHWSRIFNQSQADRSYGLDRDRFGHTVDQDHWARAFNQDQANRDYGLRRDGFAHTVDQDHWSRGFNQSQADRDYGLRRDGFTHGVDQDHWTRGFNQSQADRGYGLDRDRLGHAIDQDHWGRADQDRRFDHAVGMDRHGMNMDWANNALQNRQLDSQNWQHMQNGFMNTINSIYMNPHQSAEHQAAAVNQARQQFPGFMNEAWQMLPPGVMSDRSVRAAQAMPRMRRLRGGP